MYLLLLTGSSSEYVTAVSGGLILHCLLITNIHMRHFSSKTHLNPAWLCRFRFIPTAKFFLHSGFTKSLYKSLPLQMAQILQLLVHYTSHITIIHTLFSTKLQRSQTKRLGTCEQWGSEDPGVPELLICWLKSRLLLVLQSLDIPATEHVGHCINLKVRKKSKKNAHCILSLYVPSRLHRT